MIGSILWAAWHRVHEGYPMALSCYRLAPSHADLEIPRLQASYPFHLETHGGDFRTTEVKVVVYKHKCIDI